MISGRSIPDSVHDERELLDIIGSVVAHPVSPELGIGDDAALVKSGGEWTVATMDTMVECRHFRVGRHTGWRDVGWKAIATNQSDIAAMGAKPQHALVGLNVRRELTSFDIAELYEGMQAALTTHGGTIVGGDTVVSNEVSITVAMTGVGATPTTTFRTNGARPRYVIALTGNVGDSRGGLEAIASDNSDSNACVTHLIGRHNRPTPRTDIVECIQSAGVRCATDVSDGLLRDLEKVCVASDLTAQIDLGRIPVSPQLMEIYPDRALEFALSGGEDYELLVCAPPEAVANLNSALHEASKPPVTVIGEMRDNRTGNSGGRATIGRVVLRGQDAGDVAASLASSGWDHWSESAGSGVE